MFLKVEELSKSFGELLAVNELNLEVKQGEIVCIIGPNGAGKTTLFNLITGRLKPDAGRVLFKDEDITGLPPHKIARKSIIRSFQISNIYQNLTVYQNIRVPILSMNSKSHIFFKPVSGLSQENNETLNILKKMNLQLLGNKIADVLSHGDRKKLELGMAIAMKPSLLLLDEPTAGMNPTETEKTIYLIRDLAKELGLSLILTEHDMKVVFSLAERIAVMHYGTIICEGTPDEIKENEMVREIYLGDENWRS